MVLHHIWSQNDVIMSWLRLKRWPPGPALTGPPPAPPTGEPRCTGGWSGVACGWILGRERPYHLYSGCGGMYVLGLVLRVNGCGGMYCWGTNLCVCVWRIYGGRLIEGDGKHDAMAHWHQGDKVVWWLCLISVYFGRCEGSLALDWMYLREFLSDFHNNWSGGNSLMVRNCLALSVDGSGTAIAFEMSMFGRCVCVSCWVPERAGRLTY